MTVTGVNSRTTSRLVQDESPVGFPGTISDAARRDPFVRSSDEVLPNTFHAEPVANHEVALTLSQGSNLLGKGDTPGTHTHLSVLCEVK